MKKLIISGVVILAVILLVPISCAAPPAPMPAPAPAPAPMPEPAPTPTPLPAPESQLPFQIIISPEEAHYLPGQEVMIGLMIMNLSSGTITIDPFPPAEWIKPVDQDESVYSYAAGTRTRDIRPDLPPYLTKSIWDQKDNNGKQVAPGWYEVHYEYVIIEQNTSRRYTANPTTRFLIVHPHSAMEKNLDINQSETINGITVTLERIELTSIGMTVYTFKTPPGYSLHEGNTPPRQYQSFLINSMAEYKVDGGSIKQAKPRGQFIKSGIRFIWDDLEPIPNDAKELTFTITKLGDWEGSLEFKIPLD